MEYTLIRKRNKNMYARLDANNNLIITAPLLMPKRTIDKFAEDSYEKLLKKKSKKIDKSVFNVNGEVKILGQYKLIENKGDLNAILLVTLKNYLAKNYFNIAKMMGIENPPSVKIKRIKNYLGQYNKKNYVINLNLLLGHISEELIEYVIIHELAHIKYMNHQKEFWKLVEKYIPNYKEMRKKLKYKNCNGSYN